MANLHYTIDINAPKEKVWHTMLDLETYKEWTTAFQPGSTYVGSWDKGSKVRFVAEGDESGGGMFGQIAENIPYEYVSIEQLGEIVKGEEDTTSESAKQWAGSYENYHFSEKDGVTTLKVDLISENIGEDMLKMFDGMWPVALQKLKEICER